METRVDDIVTKLDLVSSLARDGATKLRNSSQHASSAQFVLDIARMQASLKDIGKELSDAEFNRHGG